jgi:Helix-turn-helix domain
MALGRRELRESARARLPAAAWSYFVVDGALTLQVDFATFRPLMQRVIEETLARVEADRVNLPDRLAFSEAEAARLLGLAVHVLRDERLRGRILASRIVGRRIRYTRDDLIAYLASRRRE